MSTEAYGTDTQPISLPTIECLQTLSRPNPKPNYSHDFHPHSCSMTIKTLDAYNKKESSLMIYRHT